MLYCVFVGFVDGNASGVSLLWDIPASFVIFTLHNLGRSNTSSFYWVEFSQCNSWLCDCRIGLSCVFEELSLCLDELVKLGRYLEIADSGVCFKICSSACFRNFCDLEDHSLLMGRCLLLRDVQRNRDALEPLISMKRSDYGLPEDKFLFACFNQLYKMDPEIFSTW
jgi:hypothetical protein